MTIGSSRDLTALFVKHRNDAKRSTPADYSFSENRATMHLLKVALNDNPMGIEMTESSSSACAPAWMNMSEKVREDMVDLKSQIERLKEIHNRALLVTFASDYDNQRNIDTVTSEIHSKFKRIHRDIEKVANMPVRRSDESIQTQIKKQLAGALLHLSVDFRKEQSRYLDNVERQKGIAGGSLVDMLEDEDERVSAMPMFTSAQTLRVEGDVAMIEEREAAIQKIIETINELAQMTRDLSILVQDQGTMLDRIDRHVHSVAEKVDQGVKHLVAAEEKQKLGCMFICILALVVLILLMLIIVVIKHII